MTGWIAGRSRRAGNLVGAFGFGAVLMAALNANGTPPSAFVDSGSFLFVFVALSALLLAIYGPTGIVGAFLALWRSPVSETGRDHATAFFRTAFVLSICTGILASLIGVVHALSNLSDPYELGPAAAMAVLSSFYGVGLALLAYCAAAAVSRRDRGAPGAAARAT